jgi:chaperonin GroES
MSKTSTTHHKHTLKPIGDRVLVKQLAAETMIGGIVLPDSAQKESQNAEVIALGTGKVDDSGKVQPFHVKVGDTVIISKYGGTEVKIGDQKFTIVREDDILGVLA